MFFLQGDEKEVLNLFSVARNGKRQTFTEGVNAPILPVITDGFIKWLSLSVKALCGEYEETMRRLIRSCEIYLHTTKVQADDLLLLS